MASCLGECGIYCHSRFDSGCLQCALHSLRPPPFHTHTSPGSIHTSIASILAPESQIMMFFSKSDRCDSTTRCSDGPRRCNRGSMKFNTFAEGIFLRLPRSYRVAEKSSQIGSREPNCAVFQQNPTVAQAVLDAPMDPSAINSQA